MGEAVLETIQVQEEKRKRRAVSLGSVDLVIRYTEEVAGVIDLRYVVDKCAFFCQLVVLGNDQRGARPGD